MTSIQITDISCDTHGTTARLVFEESGEPDETLRIEFDPPPARISTAEATAGWVTAAAVLALWRGERRVACAVGVCPELLENLRDATAWLCSWYYADHQPPQLDVAPLPASQTAELQARAGLFFSGGVDSTWTLQHNRALFAPGDHRRHTMGFIMRGFEIHEEASFALAVRHVRRAAQNLDLDLVAVRTNLYSAFRDRDSHLEFLISIFEGAFFAAIAHAYGAGLRRVDVATTLHLPHMAPNGSHPVLTYSSSSLAVRFDGLRHSRLDKLRDLAATPSTPSGLRVCNRIAALTPYRANCGRCNKCLSTMLGLRAAGVPGPYAAFGAAPLTAEAVRDHFAPRFDVQRAYAEDLVRRLAAEGARDLANAVIDTLHAYADKL